MCVAVRAATVIVPMRSVLMAVLFVSILLMRMIVPVLSVLMVVLFVGILLMGMIMPMRLLVFVRVASLRIIVIGHVFTSCRCLPLRCSAAKTTFRSFNQRLYLSGRNRTIRIRRIERAKDFITELVECCAPVMC